MIGYNIFMKHAEKVAKGSTAARPILQGVHHSENGSLVVTDSHRLYVAKNGQTLKDNSVIHPKTGEQIEGAYPDVSRLLPDRDGDVIIRLEDVKEALSAVKTLLAVQQVEKTGVKKTPKGLCVVLLEGNEEGYSFLYADSKVMEASYCFGYAEGLNYKMKFRVEYLEQALSLFADCGYFRVDVHLYGPNRPFVLKTDGELVALILPVRTEG